MRRFGFDKYQHNSDIMLDRRTFLQRAGAMGGLGAVTPLLGGCASSLFPDVGRVVPLVRGPYQNNGATPWYANLGIGTPDQGLKIAFDTGTNFIWSTSTLCGSGCRHYGGGQFDPAASTSFDWVSQIPEKVNFGPWGDMWVQTGRDTFTLPTNSGLVGTDTTFYLSQSYSGPNFEQLDWDGGIGFPSGSAYAKPETSFLLEDLFNQGVLSTGWPFVSFDTDFSTGVGTCRLGGYDPSRYLADEGVFLPWISYTPYPAVDYLWNAALPSMRVGTTQVASDAFFCADSGSSRFKGDPAIMTPTLNLLAASGYSADVELTFDNAVITLTPDIYMQTIEAGPDRGQTLPQFEPMAGLDAQALVGSVLMDHVYSIFAYTVSGNPGAYTLAPLGVWLFNKVGGPKLIQPRISPPALPGAAI